MCRLRVSICEITSVPNTIHACVCLWGVAAFLCCWLFLCMCACAFIVGQAPWKQQQRSSAFKWIKSPAQSPGPAGIGQNGCSLDEDLRLIIYGAAFVFAATIAYMGNTVQYMRICVLVHTSGETGISYSCVHIVVVAFSPSVLNLLLKISPAEHELLPSLLCCRSGKIPQFWKYTCRLFMFSLLPCSLSYLRFNMRAAVMVSSGSSVSVPCFLQCVSTN